MLVQPCYHGVKNNERNYQNLLDSGHSLWHRRPDPGRWRNQACVQKGRKDQEGSLQGHQGP